VKIFLGFDLVQLLVVVNVELPKLEQMSGRCLYPMRSNVVHVSIVVIEGLPTLERMSGRCLIAMGSNVVQLLVVVIVGPTRLERMFGISPLVALFVVAHCPVTPRAGS
jgi:hypothetical protein